MPCIDMTLKQSLLRRVPQFARCTQIQQPTRLIHARAKYAEDHRTFMSEVALLDGTANVPLLTETLKAQGHEPIPGYRNLGLHPYAIAMAEGTVDVWGEPVQGVLCALRWPQPSSNKNMEIPIVVMERGSRSMKLVARSAKEYTARVLAEEDLKAGESGSRPVAKCLGDAGSALYVPGNIRTMLYSKPEAFIVKQIGHFPDVSERLMQAHIDKNDETSAMVTADWTMRNMFFGKWGFPFELAANLYQSLGRSEEARDTARLALKQPWWTISDLAGMRELSKLAPTVEETYALFEQEKNGDGRNGMPEEQPTPQELAMKEANMLMDRVAAGEIQSWDEIRPKLAEHLQAAGHSDSATFLQESTRMT